MKILKQSIQAKAPNSGNIAFPVDDQEIGI